MNETMPTTAAGTTGPVSTGGREPPRRIGRYELVRELGRGGMGVVWEAIDPALDRRVALKLIREERRAELAERLRREAQALAQLDHAHVVSVYDVGLDDSEGMYVVMQHVDGTTLDRAIAAQKPSRNEIVGMFIDAGRGLAAAHAAGIVHRDFKPGNVLVDARGHVRVSDFGLARASETDGAAESIALTATITRGDLVGTPAYMAPEQFANGPVTPATDQFSFCVALWEALGGERPFGGTTLDELRDAVQHGRRRSLPARVPRRVRAVLERGLALAPGERFPSMDDLLTRLAPPPRSRWMVGGIVLAGAAAVATVAATRRTAADPCEQTDARLLSGVWDAKARTALHEAFVKTGGDNAEDAYQQVAAWMDRYAASWVSMRIESCKATFTRGEQSPALFDRRAECLDRRRAALGAMSQALAEITTRDAVNEAINRAVTLAPVADCADRESLLAVVPPPTDPVEHMRVAALDASVAVAFARFQAGQPGPARDQLEKDLAEIRALDYAPLLARALESLANMQSVNGDRDKRVALLYEAAEAAARGKDDRLVAQIWISLIGGLQRDRKLDEALAVEPFARAALARAGSHPRDAAAFDYLIGNALRKQGKLADAEPRIKGALARVPQSEPVLRADILQIASLLAKELGRYDEAMADLEESNRLYEATFGPNNGKVAVGLYNLARLYLETKRCAEARATGEREIAIVEKIYGRDSVDLVLDYVTMGDIAATCSADLPATRRYYDHALELASKPQGDTHRATVLGGYGQALGLLGRPAEGEPMLLQALAIAEERKDTVQTINQLEWLAGLRLTDHRPAEARPLYVRMAEIAVSLAADGELVRAKVGLGRCERALQRPQAAIAPLEEAFATARKNGYDEVPAIAFELAQALWDAGRDRPRARQLATEAQTMPSRDPTIDKLRATIADWLAHHP